MLGKNHTLVGVVGWLLTLPILINLNIVNFENYWQVIFSILIVAGASVIPDFDEPQATPAQTFGFFGKFLSKMFRKIAGGHRERTHSLFFPILAFGIAIGLSFFYKEGEEVLDFLSRVPVGLMALINTVLGVILFSRGMRGWNIKFKMGTAWATGLVVGTILILGAENINNYILQEVDFSMPGLNPIVWLPYAIGFGCFWHIVGDFPTKTGVPIFLPITKKRFKLPILNFRVGGKAEKNIGKFLGFLLICALIYIFVFYNFSFNQEEVVEAVL